MKEALQKESFNHQEFSSSKTLNEEIQ